MAFPPIDDVAAGDPTKASNQNAQTDAIADLNSRLSLVEATGVPNGSFEFDEDGDGEPDGFDITDNAGGTHALSADDGHGAQSLSCVTTAGGGFVEVEIAEFIPVNGGTRIHVPFDLNCSVANVRVRSQIIWYDDAQTSISTSTLYDSVANPIAWEHQNGSDNQAVSPSTARFYKVKLIAGVSGGTVAATVLFDGLSSEVFDGFVGLTRVLKNSSNSNGTTTIDISSDISGQKAVTCDVFVIVDDFKVEVQHFVGGAWSAAFEVESGADGDIKSIAGRVRLTSENTFRIVGSNSTIDSGQTTYLTGYEVAK